MATAKKTVTWGQREPGSVMHMDDGITLRTACGHSFITCHTDRCFRLPADLREERDRALTAEYTEHIKNVANESRRFDVAKRQIENTYLNLAAEGAVDGWEQL
jgi:hypothetical protein